MLSLLLLPVIAALIPRSQTRLRRTLPPLSGAAVGHGEVLLMFKKPRARLNLETLESRLAPSPVVNVNAAANVHAIDPNIYGTAFGTTQQLAGLNATVNRD